MSHQFFVLGIKPFWVAVRFITDWLLVVFVKQVEKWVLKVTVLRLRVFDVVYFSNSMDKLMVGKKKKKKKNKKKKKKKNKKKKKKKNKKKKKKKNQQMSSVLTIQEIQRVKLPFIQWNDSKKMIRNNKQYFLKITIVRIFMYKNQHNNLYRVSNSSQKNQCTIELTWQKFTQRSSLQNSIFIFQLGNCVITYKNNK
eukprot:TRINITY_DN2775_c0_g2_i7.p4 TRINITY_DN2775_c0_g2~~TRINITY_DN2775_c0_g2_i7.p4  ORF type:complete len:196 (+),score=24.22 TRINITY_DN2775_c0_g2_i7:1376-1963(+)